MIDNTFARHFAEEWIAAWNSHDLNRILSPYADDVEMSSPVIVAIAGEPSGTLKGRDQGWRVSGKTQNERVQEKQSKDDPFSFFSF